MTNQKYQEEVKQIKDALDSTKNAFILLPQNPSLDATASALALYLSLRERGESVIIGSPTQMRVEHKNLVGVDRITDKIGNRNLIISFDYTEDSIEKVSYNVEGEKFNLVIQPKSGFTPIDPKSVNFSQEGINADLIFVIGSQKLENLQNLYEKEREAFNNATVINIDRSPANTKFGQINLVNPKKASISETILQLIKDLSLKINVDIAGNLLQGIESQTQQFQAPFTSPETFEAVAELMRAGAKRRIAMPQSAGRQFPTRGPITPGVPPQVAGAVRQQSFTPPPPPMISQRQTGNIASLDEPRLNTSNLSALKPSKPRRNQIPQAATFQEASIPIQSAEKQVVDQDKNPQIKSVKKSQNRKQPTRQEEKSTFN